MSVNNPDPPVRPRRAIRGCDDTPALLRELAAANFNGPRFQQFLDDLWLLGFDVLRGLVRTGQVVQVKTGIPHSGMTSEDRQTLHDSSEARDEVILDAMLWAVPAFIEVLKQGRWSPARGASLSTYFIGMCTRGFWSAYRRWHNDRMRHLQLLARLAAAHPNGPDPQDAPLLHDQRAALRLILSRANVEQRAICVGLLEGKTQAEIGSDLGLTSRGVEGRMYQLRRQAWDLVSRGRIDPALVPGSRAALAASQEAA